MPLNNIKKPNRDNKAIKKVIEDAKRDFNNSAGFEIFTRRKMDIADKIRIKIESNYKDFTIGKNIFQMIGSPNGIQILPVKDEIIIGANILPNKPHTELKDNGANKKIQSKQFVDAIMYHYDLEEGHKYILFNNITFEKDENETVYAVINMKEGVSYE